MLVPGEFQSSCPAVSHLAALQGFALLPKVLLLPLLMFCVIQTGELQDNPSPGHKGVQVAPCSMQLFLMAIF